jgi:Na+:H+ antiporter, NhaA family
VTHEVDVLNPVPDSEQSWLSTVLKNETVGGLLLMGAALLALIWANSNWAASYESLVGYKIGPESLHLNLTLSTWAADFLLAVFFFVIGCELKHEFVHGTLSNPRIAAVPIGAALGGMLVAGAIFTAFNYGTASQAAWGLPISTDVAFALAVLAIAGQRLPMELRSFLLTLAVVNDLGAIIVIAIFYGHGFYLGWFLAAVALLIAFGFLQTKKFTSLWIFVPLALAIWYAMFRSGIHATIAGVAMGLLMRVRKTSAEPISPCDKAELKLRPLSAGFAVPVFALLAVGVNVLGTSLGQALSDPLTKGVLCGLILGQPVGVLLGAFIVSRFTKGSLNPALSWWDVVVAGSLASIGFTVALLIAEVSFGNNATILVTSKFAIIFTNLVAIVVSVLVISLRSLAIGRYKTE